MVGSDPSDFHTHHNNNNNSSSNNNSIHQHHHHHNFGNTQPNNHSTQVSPSPGNLSTIKRANNRRCSENDIQRGVYCVIGLNDMGFDLLHYFKFIKLTT